MFWLGLWRHDARGVEESNRRRWAAQVVSVQVIEDSQDGETSDVWNFIRPRQDDVQLRRLCHRNREGWAGRLSAV